METKNIRLALERLNVLAERAHAEDWPSAIERDLMLAELRNIYEALLFAAPQAQTQQPAVGSAAAAVAMVDTSAVAVAEEQPEAEPLDLESDFEDSQAPADETPNEAPAGPAAPEAPTVEETPAAEAEPVAEPENKSLLFDLGTVQHRTHRRMMSLYDDETFDRLPDSPAAAESAPHSVGTPQPEPEPQSEPEVPAAEFEPEFEEETIVETAESETEEEEVMWSEPEEPEEPEFEPEPEFGEEPEDEPEPESEPEPEPAPVRTIEDFYSESASDAAQPAPQTVLGDVMNSDVEVLGDTLAPQASLGDTLAHAPVTGGLTSALDLSERYQIIAELFGGDADACDEAFERLDEMESLEDAVIYIEENFNWNSSSPATTLVMDLLDRKFN